MTGPAAGAGPADVSTASTIGEEIGQMLGEAPDFGEAPEPDPTGDAGTTPGEPVAGTGEAKAPDAAAGDGSEKPAGDGTTPDAAATAPDESDPFAGSTPATFMVNGQPVTTEDIRVFKEGGAVITAEALPNVLQKLGERESLQARNHTQSVENQTFAKVTEWVDQSSGKTYSGPEAAIEMRIGNASLFAENQLLIQAITDPDLLAQCLTTAKGADGVERVVFSERALADLKRENSLQQREISAKVRDHYKTVIAEASKPAPAPIDFKQATDGLITELAKAGSLDSSVLTPQDKAILAKQLPFHIKDGLASVEWQELVKDRIELRIATKQNAAQVASVTAAATKDAQARMAAAARGVKPLAKPAVAPVAPVQPKDNIADNQSTAWDAMEKGAANVMRSLR